MVPNLPWRVAGQSSTATPQLEEDHGPCSHEPARDHAPVVPRPKYRAEDQPTLRPDEVVTEHLTDELARLAAAALTSEYERSGGGKIGLSASIESCSFDD